jgi:hypothetical protein
MAMPIVNFQLSKIVIDGNWKNKPVHINLGTMILDNSVVRFDPDTYHFMEKNTQKCPTPPVSP